MEPLLPNPCRFSWPKIHELLCVGECGCFMGFRVKVDRVVATLTQQKATANFQMADQVFSFH
ncbi:MAG: hypothetical protein A2048_10350 [Deltaproteobacteria bacterium GWA2_45_12]|nr:MAG: hypothetical protein A2048_10350 [Deltaproteobacteria bacterium GWA2_45_12]